MENNKDSAAARALLKKYLEGKCDAREEQQVLRWYYAFDQEDDLILAEDEKHRLARNVKAHVLTTIGRRKQQWRLFDRFKPAISIAATLTLIALAALFSYHQYFGKTSRHQHIVYKELMTLAGERKLISLSDGSKIWLNNASKLRYPETFEGSTRTVYLEGEAFFQVAHRKDKAFIIHTQKLQVQVLGTSFNVKSFGDEKQMAVTVASGKVAVNKTGSTQYLMLLPGDQAVYDQKTKHLKQQKADPSASRAWQTGELFFKYETLENICHQLERWYGVKISCTQGQLLQKRYTLKQKNESLDDVLKVLSAGDFHYKIKGNTVRIEQ